MTKFAVSYPLFAIGSEPVNMNPAWGTQNIMFCGLGRKWCSLVHWTAPVAFLVCFLMFSAISIICLLMKKCIYMKDMRIVCVILPCG